MMTHRPDRIMKYVDSFTLRFGSLITSYISKSKKKIVNDRNTRLHTYKHSFFRTSKSPHQ